MTRVCNSRSDSRSWGASESSTDSRAASASAIAGVMNLRPACSVRTAATICDGSADLLR